MDLEEAVSRLRFKLDDVKEEDEETKLSDEALENEIKDAVVEYNSDYETAEDVEENEEYLVIKLALISCLRILATRYAQKMDVSSGDINVEMTTRAKRLMNLASQFQEEYNNIINDPKNKEIEIGTLDRYVARRDETAG